MNGRMKVHNARNMTIPPPPAASRFPTNPSRPRRNRLRLGSPDSAPPAGAAPTGASACGGPTNEDGRLVVTGTPSFSRAHVPDARVEHRVPDVGEQRSQHGRQGHE